MLFLYCICHDFASAHYLLALVCGVKLCDRYFSILYPVSGVVLDSIISRS